MDEKLNELYQSMLKESGSSMTVGDVKPGELEGAKKNAKPVKAKTTPDNTVDTPEEGPSAEEVKKGGGEKNAEVAGKVDTHQKKVGVGESSRFDALFKTIVSEAEDEMGMGNEDSTDIVDAKDPEDEGFDDDLGDFTDKTDVESETDIASELRLMADRLQELADKMGVDLGTEEELGKEGEGEGLSAENIGTEGEDVVRGESVESKEDEEEEDEEGEEEEEEVKEAKSEPEPKPAKATQFGPKMSKTAPGTLSKVSAKHAKGAIKGTHTGEPQNAKATQFGPKMSLKAKASGPAAKTGSHLFA